MNGTKWSAGYAAGRTSLQAEVKWQREEIERLRKIADGCCRLQPRPGLGLGNANVFPEQLQIMEGIVERLRYDLPVDELVLLMRACGSSLDTRPRFGDEIMRCVIANGADVIETLASKIDTRPWRTVHQRVADAWAVFTQRAQAIYVRGTVYDRILAPPQKPGAPLGEDQ